MCTHCCLAVKLHCSVWAHTFQNAWGEYTQGLLLWQNNCCLQCIWNSLVFIHKSLHCAKIVDISKYVVGKANSNLDKSLLTVGVNGWLGCSFMPQYTALLFQQHNIVTIILCVANGVSEVQLWLWRVISSSEQPVCLLPPPTVLPCVSCCCYTSNSKLSRQQQVLAVWRDLLKEWGHFVISLGPLGHLESLPAIPAAP